MSHDVLFIEHLQDFCHSCACEWISAVRSPVIPCNETVLRHLFCHEESTYRHAAAECLCGRHDVRLYSGFLPRVHMTGSSHAALDFIKYQQNIFAVTQLAALFKEVLVRTEKTALALHHFHDDRTCFVRYKSFHRVKTIEIRKFYIAAHLPERLAVMLVARDRQCAVGAAVEGMVHCYDLMICAAIPQIPILHCRLECALDSLCTGICEENAIHSRDFPEHMRSLYRRLIIEIIRCVNDLIYLILERVIVFFAIVAKSEDRDPGHKIKVFLPIGVIEINAVPVVEYDLVSVICVKQVLFGLIYHLLHF